MKKRTSKLLSLLLMLAMVLGLMPTTVFAATYIEDGITVIHGNITFELSGYEIGKSATDITLTSKKQEGIILQQPTIYVGGSTTPYTGLFEPDVQYVLVLEEPTTESGYKILKGSTYYHISMTVNGEKETIEEFQNTETIHKFKMPKLYTDYGITVNGLKVTSQNKDDIYARKDGKTITNNPGTVTYDPDTKTLRIKSVLRDPDTDKNQTIIFGNGKVNIVIEPMNDTYEGYVSGKLTIRDANDVSIYCKKGKFAAIYGNADIRKVNDVKIICDDGMLTQGSLAIVDANDVFLSCKCDVGEPVLGMSGFRCNTLTVENKAHSSKFCQELFSFGKPTDKLDEKYIYEVKDKETGIYEVKEVLTDYILEFNYLGIPRDDCFRIRPEAESETINRIYFDSNGGTGNMESVLCMSDTYTLPENKFTPPEGKEFKGWSTSSTGDVFSGTSISMSDVPGSIELYAIWQDKSDVDKYDITVTDGKATIGAGTEISKAAEGTTVTLTANAAPSGKVFDKWVVESGGITLADASSATTTFTMPAGAVSVKATYKDIIHTVTVQNDGNGSGKATPATAAAGTEITLSATANSGYHFKEWQVVSGGVTITNSKFTMPASNVTVKATFAEIVVAPENPFVDVAESAYYYDAVLWAAENGITGGVDDTHFAPNATCTRAQIVTFLWRAAGSPEPENMSSFADVSADSYYAKAVAWAVEQGITTGTGDGKFSPNAPCTRAQSVTFLWRAQKSPASDSVNPFADVAADAYYNNAVLWAAENGITSGTSATTFSPNNDCTRAQIVTFLFRCLGK